jgi:hypothetical protein
MIENDDFKRFYSEFKLFRSKFEQHTEAQAEGIFGEFKRQFLGLERDFSIINEFVEESALYWSKNFNVFSILGRGELEVQTHTPFLAELLDPAGSHGQKNLFLKSFLTMLIKLPEIEAAHPNWRVKTENERIDLRVENYVLKKAIFIENKIRTGAHSGQLSRYFKIWIDGYCKGNGAFIYLSPDREKGPPGEDGFDPKWCPRDIVLERLQIWSYQGEVCSWLAKTLPMVKSPRVKETVSQYIDLIEKL